MCISYLNYFGILLLKLNIIKYTEQYEDNCTELLSRKHQEGEGIIGSLFEFSPPGVCFACSIKPTQMKRESVLEIPLYNNIIDFGFNGLHMPPEFKIEIRLTNECFLRFKAISNPEMSTVTFKTVICVNSSTFTKCYDQPFSSGSSSFNFTNWDCFSLAIAIVEPNEIRLKTSYRCQKLASALFSEHSLPMKIRENKCKFDAKNDEFLASIKAQMGREYKYDGFPVILPCSPGGYAVDSSTGRFVIGDQCYNFFPEASANKEKDGINFLVKKFYNNNEDLLFPTKRRDPYDVRPSYLNSKSQSSTRKMMEVKTKKNELKKGRERIDCNYKDKKVESPKIPCEELLKIKEKPTKNSINFYVPRNGCFLCSRPKKCDQNDTTECENYSEIKNFPLYNNLLEFGILALHFPQMTEVEIRISERCYFQISITRDSDKVTFKLFECFEGECKQLNCKGPPSIINFNNFYCFYVALSFNSENVIHFATSEYCRKFASTEFSEIRVLKPHHDKCFFYKKNYELFANFFFKDDNSTTPIGFPLIVPCSAGGVTVDPKTGRFVTGKSCRDLVWAAKNKVDGLLHVIRSVYDDNEDSIFIREKDANVAYPRPNYLKEDNTFVAHDYGKPRFDVRNREIENKSRIGCNFIDKKSSESTDHFIIPAKRTGQTTSAPLKQKAKKKPEVEVKMTEKQIETTDTSMNVSDISKASYANCDIMFLSLIFFALSL